MKKLWAGIAVLAVLLGIGIGAAMVMQHVHGDLANRLEKAAGLCKTDWQGATSLAESASASWTQHQHWIAALVDHEPLEEIESLFDQLSLCQSNEDTEEFAAVCLRIANICNMLEESHSPYWWNLL
ncbi:MAG: DUF4363 family protein [Oscillospiraceae bacterium]|nr:DUF4363 family protein [Oscillospiraceae bacterium]